MRWCGPEVEVEASSVSRPAAAPRTATSVRSRTVRLPGAQRLAGHPEPGRGRQADRQDRCHRSSASSPRSAGPTSDCSAQVAAGIEAIRNEVEIQIACSAGHAHPGAGRPAGRRWGAPLQPQPGDGAVVLPNVVTTTPGTSGGTPCRWSATPAWRCAAAASRDGRNLEQRAEFAANLAELDPHEVPLNFLNPRPGTPFGDLDVLPAAEALKAVAAFRLALPRTMLPVRRRARDHARRSGRQSRASSAGSTPSSWATT